MAIGDTFSGFAQNFNVLSAFGGESFDDPALALYEDTGFNGAMVKNSLTSWSSETVEWYFDSTALTAFITANPTLVLLEFNISYGLEDEAIGGYTVAFTPFISLNGTNLNVILQTSNDVLTSADAFAKKTATVRVYGKNIPTFDQLKDSLFSVATKFNVLNPLGDNVSVYVYEIELRALSGSGGGYVVAYDTQTNKHVDAGEIIDFGSVTFESSISRNLRLYNYGDQKITFFQNGLSADSPLAIKAPSPDLTSQTVYSTEFLNLNVTPVGAVAGASYTRNVSYGCDAANAVGDKFTFTTKYNVLAKPSGRIQVDYEGNILANNSTLALSAFSQNINSKISVRVKNTGTSALSISTITYAGNLFVAEDSMSSSTNIAVSGSNFVRFYLANSTEGAKSGTITINTSDVTENPFVINVVFSILPQTKLEFKSGANPANAIEIVQNGDTEVLGVIEKSRPLRKSFVLSNSGIYKSLIINSITTSNTNITLQNLPSLPATLQKNNANSIAFDLYFLTSSSGLKTTDLVVDYSEGA